MKYDLIYLTSFIGDMRLIIAYLSQHSEAAANKFADEVEKQVEDLKNFPKRFARYEKMPMFHRMPVLFDYQIFYTVDDGKKQVQVHHALHGHRNIQKFLQHENETAAGRKLP